MLRQIYYQFLVYRSIVAPFLVVSSIAVPCWLLFRWYRLRATRQSPSLKREGLLLVFVLYLSGLAAATLAPNHNPRLLANDTTGIEIRPSAATLTCSSAFLPGGSRAQAFCIYNAKGNLLLFIPFGILIPLIWRRLSFWKGIQAAIALSLTIEILQYVSRAWGSYRAADINDIILNVLGASLGLILVHALRALMRSRRAVAPLSSA
jgi:glycopeptide antibiotics resistance protein